MTAPPPGGKAGAASALPRPLSPSALKRQQQVQEQRHRKIEQFLATQRERAMLLRASAFTSQRRFIDDDSQFKAALCTRRAGKTRGTAIQMLATALERPGANVAYLSLTRGSAKDIVWRELAELCHRFGIAAEQNQAELSLLIKATGSRIKLHGVDSNEDAKAKLRGQAFDLVVLDEVQDFRTQLRQLVDAVLTPAIAERRGAIVMIGTPNDACAGFFYDVTRPELDKREPGWSVHAWSWRDNPHVVVEIDALIERRTASSPLYPTTNLFRQEWLGHWVKDESGLVYRFSEQLNTVQRFPYRADDVFCCLAADPGIAGQALLVVAWHPHDPTLYVVEAIERQGMDVTDVVDEVRRLAARWPVSKYVIDPASAQVVEEMRRRHGLPWESAPKTSKFAFISMMNADLQRGRIRVVLDNDGAHQLVKEWKELTKLRGPDGQPLLEEDRSSSPNHLADACLYAWRVSRQYLSQAPEVVKPKTVEELEDERFQQLTAMQGALPRDEADPVRDWVRSVLS